MRSLSAVRALVAISLITGLSGCILTSPEKANSLQPVDGGKQTLAANATAGKPLTVRVLDVDGEPMEGVAVNWLITRGGGTISAASSSTDDDGMTSVSFTAGATTGTTIIFATVPQLGASVSFTMTVQ